MNIFVLDSNPHLAAQAICDQHLNKMILESTQMICTALHTLLPGCYIQGTMYKPVQPTHPCNRWLVQSKANIDWLYSHARTMGQERIFRFPTREPHAALVALDAAMSVLDSELNSEEPMTPFARVLPTTILQKDTVLAYRQYYQLKSISWYDQGKKPMSWTIRETPTWMIS